MIEIRTRPGTKICQNNLWIDTSGQLIASIDVDTLEGINLSHRQLSYADLHRLNLMNSNLSYSLLGGANLEEANVKYADLSYTNLAGANLRNTALVGSDLSNAQLVWAELYGANLEDTKVDGALFDSAYYDNKTRWPLGFDPIKAGAILVSLDVKERL
jgi:uncharacterized protein YjbI with pentapeptide repeats